MRKKYESENDILEAMVLYDQYKPTKENDDNSYEAFFSNFFQPNIKQGDRHEHEKSY